MNINPYKTILSVMRSTRRRLRVTAMIATAGLVICSWSLIILLFAFLVAGVFDPSLVEWILWVCLGGSAIGLVAVFFGRVFRLSSSDTYLAQIWEERIPALADGLLASVQFSREWSSGFRGSRQMAIDLVKWVEEQIRDVDLSVVISSKLAVRSWTAVGLSGLAWLVAYTAAPDRLRDGLSSLTKLNHIQADGTQLKSIPIVGDVNVTIEFPDYIKRAKRNIPNSTGTIRVPKGSRLKIEATSMVPISGAYIMVDDQEISLTVRDQRVLSGSLLISKPVDWRFGLLPLAGSRQMEAQARKISIQPDKIPSVRLNEPAIDLELKNIRDVPVEFGASDDYGLKRVAIALALANDMENAVRVEQGGVAGKNFRGADEVDLSVIDAQPGDKVALFVEAYDNNSVDGSQKATSEVRYITIRSPLKAHLALTEALNSQIGRLLDDLADRLEFDSSLLGATQTLEKLGEFNANTRKVISGVKELAMRMTEDPLTPAEVSAGLLDKITASLAALDVESARLESLQHNLTPPRNSRPQETVVGSIEDLIIYIEAVVARLALENMSALANELKEAKERLKDLISAYRENPNDALKSRILRNIRRLKDRMAQLQSRLAKLRQKLPKEFLNIDGFKENKIGKGLSKTRSQLDEIEKMLAEGRIEDALKAVDDMSQSLDELTSALDKDMQDLHDSTNPEKQKAISELMDRTRDLMNRQNELRKQTQEQVQRDQKAQKELLENQLKDQLAEIKREAALLRADVDEVARAPWTMRANDDLNTLNERITGLLDALDAEQIMPALEKAESIMSPLNRLKYSSRFVSKAPGLSQQVERAKVRDDKIIRQLSKLMNDLRQAMNQTDRQKKSNELQKQQAELEKSTQNLKDQLKESESKVPGLGKEAGAQIEGAQKAMGQARKELGRTRPGRARSGQNEAISKLQSVMKSLKKAAKPQKAERGGDGRGPESRRKVKIPGADEHKTPDAFRKDLLDAMKDKAPENYQDAVRKYYESLVK